MNADEVLVTLQRLGKPELAAIYKRHGAGESAFGVLTSEVTKLRKKIKRDHTLALELWRTGNAEARVLALQIADPAQVTAADAERFLGSGSARFLGSYLCDLIARSPVADDVMGAWMQATDELHREAGYGLFSARLKNAPEAVSSAIATEVLKTIEQEIHGSANWARYGMNNALISIGIYKPSLRQQAMETAARVGKVKVDHGDTNCKTPDAAPYIEQAAKRKAFS